MRIMCSEKLRRTLSQIPPLLRSSVKGLFRIPEVWYQQPIYYKANRFSVIGSGEDIEWPPYAEMMDYEMEFGIFIAKVARTFRKTEPESIFSVIPSSMTSVHETLNRLRCPVDWVRPRVKILTREILSAPGW